VGTPQDQPPPLLPTPWPCLSGWLRTASKDGVPVEEYRYNANESRIYEMNAQRRISGRDLTYSDEDHLLTVGGIVYAYDRDGFLQSRTDGSETTAYDYSSRGELLGASRRHDHRLPPRSPGLAYDQVSSLRAVADASGTMVKEIVYDTFGNMLSDTNPAFVIPFGFAAGDTEGTF